MWYNKSEHESDLHEPNSIIILQNENILSQLPGPQGGLWVGSEGAKPK